MTSRRFHILLAPVWLLALAPPSLAIDTPTFTGPKHLEAKYRQDWYACYSEAERTVPAVNVQAAGQQAISSVAIALAVRNKSVENLAFACMGARGYEQGTTEGK